jgi:hypothetical protein
MYKAPIRIQYEDDGDRAIVFILDADRIVLFHIVERDYTVDAIVRRIAALMSDEEPV